MRQLLRQGSLGRRVFLALIVGELVFAAVLSVTIGVFATLTDVRQREEAVRQMSSLIAAGLMPMIADQQITHVQAQLSSILETARVHDVIGISIRDASNTEIASRGSVDAGTPAVEQVPSNPLSALLDEQLVVQPVVVDGLQVATVLVRFSPPGLGSLEVPAIASVLVLLSVVIVSLPWTAWKLAADVVEPLDELGTFATQIAEGNLDASLPPLRGGEIGELQELLRQMAEQLKERDQKIRDSFHELETAYGSLEQAKNEIEELSAVKSNFVAVAAHEIRGPLTTISLYAELLGGGEMGQLDGPAQEAVAAISSATSRLATVVSDLMDSALLERGLLPISFGDVRLVPLIEEAAKDNGPLAHKRDMTVEVDGEVPDVVFSGDETRLRQVLDNLLSNAIKYSPQGSGVTVRACADDGWIDIEVADEGRGVPPGGRSQLFALFGRVDFGDSRDTAGLGLGLAISARIVEAHGGHLTMRENVAGKGSVFCIRLPQGGLKMDARRTTIRVVGEDGNG